MNTLRQFSEKDKNYFAYQARQNYLRQQMSVYGELDATKLREQQALRNYPKHNSLNTHVKG